MNEVYCNGFMLMKLQGIITVFNVKTGHENVSSVIYLTFISVRTAPI